MKNRYLFVEIFYKLTQKFDFIKLFDWIHVKKFEYKEKANRQKISK
jgi:hypothetical protein